MIPEQFIYAWRNFAPWPNDDDVEQDLILTRLIHIVYSHATLGEKLAFRGGTCLNKLYWKKPVRYSEDLDFVQIHPEPIGETIKTLRAMFDALFQKKGSWEARSHSYRINYSYQSELGKQKRKVKIEINTREHVAFEGYYKQELKMESPWHSGNVEVISFCLEELLATKLRALYQRRKGRDLFDLWKAQLLKPDWPKVVTLFQKYMALGKKPIHRDLLIQSLTEKVNDKIFQIDTTPLVIDGNQYNVRQAADFVINQLYSIVPVSKSKVKQIKKLK